MADTADHVILICATCEGESAAEDIQRRIAADLPDGFAFRKVDCMAGCDRPATVGFQAPGKASYLFGDIASGDDMRALSRFARQYRHSPTGWTAATERPEALLDKTLARLPGLTPEAET